MKYFFVFFIIFSSLSIPMYLSIPMFFVCFSPFIYFLYLSH